MGTRSPARGANAVRSRTPCSTLLALARSRNVPNVRRADAPRWRRWLRCPLVVIQQTTKPRTPTNSAGASSRCVPIDQPILKSLVIPLAMVVIDECLDGLSKVALAERHHSIEALVLDRPYEPLGVRVRIRRLKRRMHDVHPRIAQQPSHIPAPFPITIPDHHAMVAQQAVGPVRLRPTWRMKKSFGCGVDPTICTRRDARSITNTV